MVKMWKSFVLFLQNQQSAYTVSRVHIEFRYCLCYAISFTTCNNWRQILIYEITINRSIFQGLVWNTRMCDTWSSEGFNFILLVIMKPLTMLSEKIKQLSIQFEYWSSQELSHDWFGALFYKMILPVIMYFLYGDTSCYNVLAIWWHFLL